MRSAVLVLAVLLGAQTPEPSSTPDHAPGAVFDDCESCPEVVVIPGGTFTMGSTDGQKAWAAAHGATPASVADESPQVRVSIRSFALGEYDVTRQQYAAFVRETGYHAGNGCGLDSFKPDQDPNLSWENPGFPQSDLDPVVCVSWTDAQAYVAWVNQKAGETGGTRPYRLPSEAEWEYAARAGTASLFWWGTDPAAAPGTLKTRAAGRTRSA
jgi:formylglycine-generating enzyme required for sulfatase activity